MSFLLLDNVQISTCKNTPDAVIRGAIAAVALVAHPTYPSRVFERPQASALWLT